jgi:hypothetical protein
VLSWGRDRAPVHSSCSDPLKYLKPLKPLKPLKLLNQQKNKKTNNKKENTTKQLI